MSTDSATVPEVVKPAVTEVRPKADEDKILAYVHEKYRTGEWRWIQDNYRRGDSGRCLYQAISDAARYEGYDWGHAALMKVQDVLGQGIPSWNDSPKRTFDDVLNVLERAIIGVRSSAIFGGACRPW